MDKLAPSAIYYKYKRCRIIDVIILLAELTFFTVNLLDRPSQLLVKHITELAKLSGKPDNSNHFILMPGLCCMIIFIVSGHCRPVTMIIPADGDLSNKHFQNQSQKPNIFSRSGLNVMNSVCGSGVSGNTLFK